RHEAARVEGMLLPTIHAFCMPVFDAVGELSLAIVALARGAWRDWRTPRIALPVMFVAIGLAVLQVSATSRQLYILPFFAPLALVAAQAIERLPHRLHLAWD
ncbi:hypothetical protein, partial [Bacillus cereus group sp. BC22]|uniref:hypothetical protein n=1 Tax=Bacillus cereus group sp. BC22 TaxID=3445341 RepID=UPI003F6A03E2